MINILITDGMEKTSLEELKKMNYNIVEEHYSKEELFQEVKKYNILIIRSATKITKDIIDEARKTNNLQLIIRAGVGLDNIDVEYATLEGIAVRNTPSASKTAVAELVIGHILNMARFLHHSNITMRNGEWNKNIYQGIEIEGKTLGIVGFGRIGRELAKKAKALGMKIKLYDVITPIINNKEYEFSDLDELFARSDFISFHVPHKTGEKSMIGREEIEKMKDGVYLVNCARGGVIDEDTLIEALDNGKVAGAAIDVFMNEPKPDPILCNHDRVSITPHIGASTREAQWKIGQEINNIILEFWKESKLSDNIKTI